MEGPSLLLAAQQLKPFVRKRVLGVSGNTKIGKERMDQKVVQDIFSWGKHLVFQFDTFAMRIHFMLFGSFRATIDGKSVTGDYKKKNQAPRLVFTFRNGEMESFSCSIKYIEDKHAKESYDFSIDIMSEAWDSAAALKKMLARPTDQVADILLDQTVFAGVGNIIKNEVLFITRVHPEQTIGKLTRSKLKTIIATAQSFSHQFYEWRKEFVLRKNLRIYRKSACPLCGTKVIRGKTGRTERWSYYCPIHQKRQP